MSVKNIGNVISELRKAKGVKQDDLAAAVGVSAQAVSKWENGGTPDTELLPAIADYFDISMDRLFGRSIGDYSDLQAETVKFIASVGETNRVMEAYKLCWAIQQGLSGTNENGEAKYREFPELPDTSRHSGMEHLPGMSMMAMYKDLQYYFIMPKLENGLLASLPEMAEYQKLFYTLSDIDVLNALAFLCKRERVQPFTVNLLVKELSVTAEKAEIILEALGKYHLLWEQEIELDDEVKKVNSFNPSMGLAGFLVFAKEIINRANNWYWYHSNDGNIKKLF